MSLLDFYELVMTINFRIKSEKYGSDYFKTVIFK